ncbi:MAG: helix-turn-helix domain-containing protein [Propionicimonas sp.]
MYAVSVDTLRRRIATGELPASRIGARLIRVRTADLDRVCRPIVVVQRTTHGRRA